MKVIYTSSAQEGLDAIGVWIALDDPDRAISFVRKLQDVADDLASGPQRFPPLDALRSPDVHRRNYRGYRILYQVTADHIVILHVRHGRHDTPDF